MTTPVTYNSKTYTTYMTYNTIQKFTLLTIRYDHKFITTLFRIALTHWQYLFIYRWREAPNMKYSTDSMCS